MLHITHSCKTLVEELRLANIICSDIISTINHVDANTNFKREFGHFILNMPVFKIISRDAADAQNLLRKVCTGELEPNELLEKFVNAQQEICKLLNLLTPIS